MDHEVIHAQQQRALDLLAKRRSRFLQEEVVYSGKINEVITVDENRRDLCLLACLLKKEDICDSQRLRHPAARIAREELHCVATSVFRDDQRVMNPSFDRSVKPD